MMIKKSEVGREDNLLIGIQGVTDEENDLIKMELENISSRLLANSSLNTRL